MKRNTRVLIVEDSLAQVGHILTIVREAGFEPRAVISFTEAKDALASASFDILMTDIHLTASLDQDSFEGLNLLDFAAENHPEMLCLAMSSDPKIETYRRALKRGALHFFRKPLLSGDEFSIGVESARSRRVLSKRGDVLRQDAYDKSQAHVADGLVIDARTREIAQKVALSRQIPLVITGETGTGKEEIAKLVHRRRVEIDGALPFVAVNCANLTSDLAASLLFGHRKGAFTGASETTNGFVGEANGGILFLDEIHALPMQIQQRLLRVLNDGAYERVGDTRTLHAGFQVIAASTRDLDDEVDAGAFLLDLRMRLIGVDLALPPLRDRLADLPALIAVALAKEGVSVPAEERERIAQKCAQYTWRGNIRQLFKVLQSLVVMASFNGEDIKADNLPVFRNMVAGNAAALSIVPRLGLKGLPADALTSLGAFLAEDGTLENAASAFEKLMIQAAMARHSKIVDVARILDLARSTLDVKRKNHGL